MAQKAFSPFEFLVYGLRAALENIRLFILAMITFGASIVGSVIVAVIIASPAIMKIKRLMSVFSKKFLACSGAQQCMLIKKELLSTLAAISFGNILLGIAALVFILFVIFGLVLGFMRIALDLRDNGKSSPKRLFSCFHLVPKFFVSSLLFLIIVSAGFVAFVIPGIYLAVKFFFFGFYIVDQNAGVIECLKKSYRATQGIWWDVLGVAILTPIVASILPVFGGAVSIMIMVAAYKMLPGNSSARSKA